MSFLQNGRGRALALLGLFALVMATAVAAAPDRAPAPRPFAEPIPPGAARLWRVEASGAGLRLDAAGAGLRLDAAESGSEAAALEALLSRYDALIRALETRSMTHDRPQADSALAELRALRGLTYAAARRGFRSAPPEPR